MNGTTAVHYCGACQRPVLIGHGPDGSELQLDTRPVLVNRLGRAGEDAEIVETALGHLAHDDVCPAFDEAITCLRLRRVDARAGQRCASCQDAVLYARGTHQQRIPLAPRSLLVHRVTQFMGQHVIDGTVIGHVAHFNVCRKLGDRAYCDQLLLAMERRHA